MDKTTAEALVDSIAGKAKCAFLAIGIIAILLWIAGQYLDPGLRKAIVYSGFGMC
ncbi:MAG: hypothetical protein NT159_15015 [Proteobacteria bacterium]|nr:hypothetical protein [Pseudomonadota bacterium]